VWVKLLVSETGDVESVDVISGNPILAKAAVDAFKKWKFKPYIKNGHAVKTSLKMPINFAFRGQVTGKPISPNSGIAAIPERVRVAQGIVATPERVRVGQGIMQGLKIHDAAPIYPEEARQSRVQGTVLLRAVIGKDGLISKLDFISGPKQLIQAAMGAVRQWRYKPYILNSEPVEVDTQITVNFTLDGHR
jgi:TonB family protein